MANIIPLDLPAAYWRGRAQRAQRAGNAEEAVRLYRAALRQHADNATRRELAQVYAQMRCISASDRLYMENLARDGGDTDSLYGLASNRSLVGDTDSMAAMLDLYLRLSPCGEQADRARDILWELPRRAEPRKRLRRAQTLLEQAARRRNDGRAALRKARQSWRRGRTAETAQFLSSLYLRRGKHGQALKYAGEASALAPEEMTPRLLMAEALKRGGSEKGCRAALQGAAARCQEIEQLPVFCRYALNLQQADLAAALLEAALREHPSSVDIMQLLAMALYEMPGNEARVRALLLRARELDGEDPILRVLLAMPEKDGADEKQRDMGLLDALTETVSGEEDEGKALHERIVRLMRVPAPGAIRLAAELFRRTGDALGLRMALLEDGLSPMDYAVILRGLEDLQSPMPYFARVEGQLCLLPQKPRPPYDADLHALIRRLLRRLGDGAPVRELVARTPEAWRALPENARRHCAQSRGDDWTAAFAAYTALCAGDADEASAQLRACRSPRRAGRIYRRLIRRSKRLYEVY